MANCINCGTKIGAFDSSSRALYPGTQEILCGKCLSAFRKKFEGVEIERDFIDAHYDDLKDIGFTASGIGYLEGYVTYKNRNVIQLEEQRRKEEDLQRIYHNRAIFKTTTGFDFDGYSIAHYLGVVSGEVVMGTGIFSEFSAGISDLFGTKSVIMAQKITEAKNAALQKLIDNCLTLGANAAIGIDIDVMTLNSNMIAVCANGTAVIIQKS